MRLIDLHQGRGCVRRSSFTLIFTGFDRYRQVCRLGPARVRLSRKCEWRLTGDGRASSSAGPGSLGVTEVFVHHDAIRPIAGIYPDHGHRFQGEVDEVVAPALGDGAVALSDSS